MADLRQKTCCFTGHRELPVTQIPAIRDRTERCVRLLYNNGVRYFGVGGALGYDTLAAQLLLRLRQDELKDIRVILVYPFEGFTDRWDAVNQHLYDRLLPYYDKTVCVSQTPSREAYLERDRHLVDASAYCIGYCVKDSGGTAYTMRYARTKRLTVYNVGLEPSELR